MINSLSAATITVDPKTPGGLEQAIETAKDGDTIYLKNGVFTVKGSFGTGIYVDKNIKIKGQSNKVVRTGKVNTPLLMFKTTGKGSASLENIKITNTNMGAVQVLENSKFFVKKCTFSNNKGGTGGAFMSNKATVAISDSVFTNNQASNCAGAINFFSSKVTVTKATFKGNKAATEGGAISSGSSSLTITKCTFSNNKAMKKGGAFYMWSSTAKIVDSKFNKNIAGKKYNAIDKDKSSKLTKKNVKITPKDGTKV